MLSVAIHKDIAEYQPKVIGKLTGRTLISITVALGLSIAVAVYMNLVLKIDPTDHLEFIYAVSLPCWCCGFWKPHGLPFEQFALLWLQHQLSDNRLFYKPSMFKSGFVKTPDEITQSRKGKLYDKSTRKFLDGTNGLEAYSPTDMSEIKTKIRTYNDVIDLFGEEKAADMLSEALDWSTIDPKNDKKNIMERKPLLLDPYMTYEGEDYCKHIVAGFLGDRDLDWASGYIDEEKIKNGQVMPADLKSALSMALDNELSTSWAYLDALSSQCAEIFNKFAEYIESAGLASGVLVPGEYELDSNALNADVSERFNIQYGFQCDQMIDAMQFDMTLILTEKVDSMDGYRLIQSVCDWREENLEVIRKPSKTYGNMPPWISRSWKYPSRMKSQKRMMSERAWQSELQEPVMRRVSPVANGSTLLRLKRFSRVAGISRPNLPISRSAIEEQIS